MATPASNLPSGKSPTLVVVHPTEAEKQGQFRRNGVSWRGALSLGAYLRREEHLASQVLTKNGGITYWVLVDSATPANQERVVLSGCETYRKRALVARNGRVQDTICHGIGSVFCPKELRGRGYAARMMRDLGKQLQHWQTTDEVPCLFSILYSDIGKEFYAAQGWEPFNSSHISLDPSQPANPPAPSLPEATPLTSSSLAPLCDVDAALLRSRLARHTAAQPSRTAVALVPDAATIAWHHAREEFVAGEIHAAAPEVKGALVSGNGYEEGKRVWCYWTRMFYNANPDETKDNTLHLLRLVIEDAEDGEEYRFDASSSSSAATATATTNGVNGTTATNGTAVTHGTSTTNGTHGITNGVVNGAAKSAGPERHIVAVEALLRAALAQAKLWGMADVEVWNPAPVTVEAARRVQAQGGNVVCRDTESIASLMWYGEPVANDGASVGEVVDWVGNEKYGWC